MIEGVKLCLVAACLLLSYTLQGQFKYESEKTVSIEEVPERARHFLKDWAFAKSIKWYREERINGFSYEAKVRVEKRDYSIEFDSTGIIEDIEISIRHSDLSSDVSRQIEGVLKDLLDDFRIMKRQLQYSGSDGLLTQFLETGLADSSLTLRYEFVVKGRRDRRYRLYEFLFDSNGNMLKESVVLLDNIDNLEF